MTRADAKAAMDAGKKIRTKLGTICYMDINNIKGPYISTFYDGERTERMDNSWNYLDDAFILPEPKTRPCTQLEILAIQTKPNRVIMLRNDDDGRMLPSQKWNIDQFDVHAYQWAEFDAEGTLGPWHDFVVEVEA